MSNNNLKNLTYSILLWIFVLLFLLTLGGCGGGDSNDENGDSNSDSGDSNTDAEVNIMKVTSSLGQIYDADVVAISVTDGSEIPGTRTLLGSDGSTEIALPDSFSGPLRIDVMGNAAASYFDEATNGLVPFTANHAIRVYLPKPQAEVGVSALTEIAASKLARLSNVTADDINTVNQAIQNSLAPTLDITHPPYLINSVNFNQINNTARIVSIDPELEPFAALAFCTMSAIFVSGSNDLTEEQRVFIEFKFWTLMGWYAMLDPDFVIDSSQPNASEAGQLWTALQNTNDRPAADALLHERAVWMIAALLVSDTVSEEVKRFARAVWTVWWVYALFNTTSSDDINAELDGRWAAFLVALAAIGTEYPSVTANDTAHYASNVNRMWDGIQNATDTTNANPLLYQRGLWVFAGLLVAGIPLDISGYYASILWIIATLNFNDLSPALTSIAQLSKDARDGLLDGKIYGKDIPNIPWLGGIAESWDSTRRDLSGGQRQRVAVARATPELDFEPLLVDEPVDIHPHTYKDSNGNVLIMTQFQKAGVNTLNFFLKGNWNQVIISVDDQWQGSTGEHGDNVEQVLPTLVGDWQWFSSIRGDFVTLTNTQPTGQTTLNVPPLVNMDEIVEFSCEREAPALQLQRAVEWVDDTPAPVPNQFAAYELGLASTADVQAFMNAACASDIQSELGFSVRW